MTALGKGSVLEEPSQGTRPNPAAHVLSRGVYLYHHLKGEHASENIVEVPQDL